MTFQILLDEIKSNVNQSLQELDYPIVSFSVEPAKKGYGDVTSNVCFLLAKDLKKKPNEIAQKISENYQKHLSDLVSKVEAHPSGYLNFFANMNKLNELVIKSSIKDDFGFVDIGKKSRIVIEHTSVNPNKALHIGHVRNIIIGDTLARILEKANFDVKILNYIDDSGLQVADIIVGFKHLGFSETPPSGQKFDHYCGDEVYVKTSEKYETEPNLQETRKKILEDIENPESEISKFANSITKKVLACQLETCWNLDVTYDCLNFESEIIHSGLWEKIFEKLKEMKILEFEKEGKNKDCWVIRGKEKEEDKVVVRSNGTATYIAKDITYAAFKLGLLDDPFNYKKYEQNQPNRTLWQTTLAKTSEPKQNFAANKAITVIDSRQSRLQKIVTEIMSKFTSNPESYVHLAYESVTLSSDTAKQLGMDTGGKQAQMSGRKGLYVSADSVYDMLIKKTIQETKKRNLEMKDDEVQLIAYQVAVGTLRYEMIKPDLDKIITFDLIKSLSLEGDTAPYIQYTYARATRILEKAGFSPNFDSSFDLLNNEFEAGLIKTIGLFDIQVKDTANNLSPKVIAKYCYNLAVSFNAFYEHVRVLDSGDEPLVNARLCLVSSFKSTLGKALNLLGIPSPERM
ncbi:MAG: arginine--tRNA ligase [Marine Group I thaumarchaeote]|nr:MAG: arginine--tRNA ligase [Marine Group I thaumarchaeote]